MTSLELSKAFEVEFNKTVESQERQIKEAFEETLDNIKDNISSYLSEYDDDSYFDVTVCVPFICLDAVEKWAYEYFEKMDNVVVESILFGHTYPEETEITQIELKIYV